MNMKATIPLINQYINTLFRGVPIDAYQGYRTYTECVVNGAKCYDFARHKAQWMINEGINAADMEYIVCKPTGPFHEPHAVLGFYDNGIDDDPLILDNLTPEILPLSERGDLDVDARIPCGNIA